MFRDFLQDLIRLIKSSIGKFETYKDRISVQRGFSCNLWIIQITRRKSFFVQIETHTKKYKDKQATSPTSLSFPSRWIFWYNKDPCILQILNFYRIFFILFIFIIIGAIDRDILNPPVIELLKFSMHITQQFLKDVNSLIEA